MNEFGSVGKILIAAGIGLALLGGLIWLLSRFNLLGGLPGDIRIERPEFTCLIPLASSIVLSILLTILLNVILRILNK
jgi:hypothetical protein